MEVSLVDFLYPVVEVSNLRKESFIYGLEINIFSKRFRAKLKLELQMDCLVNDKLWEMFLVLEFLVELMARSKLFVTCKRKERKHRLIVLFIF